MKFRNLTPHEIVFQLETGELRVPPCGVVVRVQDLSFCASPLDIDEAPGAVPVSAVDPGTVTLPPALPHTVDIVSRACLDALTDEQQLDRHIVAPHTGSTAVRNAAGQVVAVRGVIRRRAGSTTHCLWRWIESNDCSGWVIASVHPTRDEAIVAHRAGLRGMAPLGPRLGGDVCWRRECLVLPLGETPAPDAKGEE